MKKLLIITSTFPKHEGDAKSASFVFELAKALKQYYQVYVLTAHSYGVRPEETWAGIRVYRFRYFFPSSLQILASGVGLQSDIKSNPLALLQLPLFFIAAYSCALKLVKREKIDIINSHWVVPQGLIGAVVKKVTGVTHVITPHAADVFLLKRLGSLGRMIARFILHNSNHILPVSNYIKLQMEELTHLPKPYTVIPMGVNTDKFKENPDKKILRKNLKLDDIFTFLFVGKFVEKKGTSYLIRAAKIIKDKGIDFRLVLVGGGPLERDIKNLVDKLELSCNVKLLGWMRNDLLPDIYAASDILVVPSIFDSKGETEGMPVVINEAFACAVPVLASNISGIPDMVKDGKNGWLIPFGDTFSLAEKMEEAMNLPNLEHFRKNALQAAKDVSYVKIAKKYFKAIEDIKEKIYTLKLNTHNCIKLEIESKHPFYIDYFRKEYPSMFYNHNLEATADLKLFIDTDFPEIKKTDIYLKKKFKKIHPYVCLVRGLEKNFTEIYFKTSTKARLIYPELSAVFLQAEILEPLIYFKALNKDMLLIHSSAVFNKEGGYIFAAGTKVGKTTIALHLVNKGFGFLGDDLVFLSKEGRIYSYPKRIHFFSYLKDKNPFLKISKKNMLRANFRLIMRNLLKLITAEEFYLSTRLDINDIMDVKIADYVEAKRIFLLIPASTPSLANTPEFARYQHIIDTCDTRRSLIEGILEEREALLSNILKKEKEILTSISKQFRIENILVEDPTKSSLKIMHLIENKL